MVLASFFFLSIYPIWLVLHLKQHCTKMHQRNLCAQKDRRRLRLLLWKESDSFNLFLLYIISKTSAHARVSMMLSEKKEFFFRKILPFAPPPHVKKKSKNFAFFLFKFRAITRQHSGKHMECYFKYNIY